MGSDPSLRNCRSRSAVKITGVTIRTCTSELIIPPRTGVVMVIYLEEAVRRKIAAAGELTIEGLHQAVMEGALLRLRPKVMTVATVVAGLLPIMWSTRTGAEVMKPLATPVLGGMISSLVHVLIVTPVIFTALRERQLRAQRAATSLEDRP